MNRLKHYLPKWTNVAWNWREMNVWHWQACCNASSTKYNYHCRYQHKMRQHKMRWLYLLLPCPYPLRTRSLLLFPWCSNHLRRLVNPHQQQQWNHLRMTQSVATVVVVVAAAVVAAVPETTAVLFLRLPAHLLRFLLLHPQHIPNQHHYSQLCQHQHQHYLVQHRRPDDTIKVKYLTIYPPFSSRIPLSSLMYEQHPLATPLT